MTFLEIAEINKGSYSVWKSRVRFPQKRNIIKRADPL